MAVRDEIGTQEPMAYGTRPERESKHSDYVPYAIGYMLFPIEIRFTNDEGHYGFFAQRNP